MSVFIVELLLIGELHVMHIKLAMFVIFPKKEKAGFSFYICCNLFFFFFLRDQPKRQVTYTEVHTPNVSPSRPGCKVLGAFLFCFLMDGHKKERRKKNWLALVSDYASLIPREGKKWERHRSKLCVIDMNNNVRSVSPWTLITCSPQPGAFDRLAFVASLSRLYTCKVEPG